VRLSIVPALWPGETITEIRTIARGATDAGCPEVWVSEANGYDAFALASGLSAGGDIGGADVVVGPIPLGVRDPALAAQGIASLQVFAEGRLGVALGTSSRAIVEQWHGREFPEPVAAMEAYLPALAAAAGGEKTDHSGPGWSTRGFKLNVAPPGLPHISIAALGNRMLCLAGALADRVVVNLVTPGMVSNMKEVVARGSSAAGRPTPPLVVWVIAGSTGYADERAGAMLPAYLSAAGYRQRLEEMSMVETFRSNPRQAVAELGMLNPDEIDDRLDQFLEAGADEVAFVISGGDPGGPAWIDRLASRNWEVL
jgi:alkanesulfonate monooxygenase SsuD/methylene tetrahydromethanopterin reductase-like flavin-dependent oxidoreductase (luciferase family)